MKQPVFVIGIVILVSGILSSCSGDKTMDRQSLVLLMEQYLDALPGHDPSMVPMAPDVKLVENTRATPVGEGLWKTATGGPTSFKIYVADPTEGQVAFMGVMEENDTPTIVGARLKVVDGEITEIDHLIVHSDGRPLNENMSRVRPGLLEKVDPAQWNTREEMLRMKNTGLYSSIRSSFTTESQKS